MEKNQIFAAQITGCTSQGFGVARLEDRALFVRGAIPGERCEIKVVKVTKTAVWGPSSGCWSPRPTGRNRSAPISGGAAAATICTWTMRWSCP